MDLLQGAGDGAASIPDYPDDAEIPSGEEGISWAIQAANEIKAQGNDSFKQASFLSSTLKGS